MSNDKIEFKEFKEFKKKFTLRIHNELEKILVIDKSSNKILEPMRYSSLNGSKYIRSLLVYATGSALNLEEKFLDQPATAIELIHTYSLIHDDLPCMDNDDIRRGVASCHVKFNESSAVLAGDALQSLAFEILSKKKFTEIDDKTQLNWINYLSKSIGYKGIAEGQFLDLSINNKYAEIDFLNYIYSLKTSSLIKACIVMPAMLKVDLSNSIHNKFEEFGRILGISFQIKDDLLGYTISTEILGKTKNKDEIRNQPNYVNILGVDNAKKKLEDYKNHINELLIDMKIEKSMLFEISNYIFKRHF